MGSEVIMDGLYQNGQFSEISRAVLWRFAVLTRVRFFSRRLFFAPRGYRRAASAHAQGARRAIAVCGISRKKRPQSMRAVWRIFRLDAQRAVLLNVISDGFQGRYNGFAERKVPRSAPERTLQSPWRNMNLSCIFSRKSSLNFLSPRPRPASEI